MFLRKITFLKPALCTANKLQATIHKSITKRPQAAFSMFQSSSNKFHQQNNTKLFTISKFSFSVSSLKHITQSTCLRDLELIKDQIPAESLASIREHLTKYANEKDLSTLSKSEIQQLSQIFGQFVQLFMRDPRKRVQYTEADALCQELMGSVPFQNYMEIFFDYWEFEQTKKAKLWVEKILDFEKKIKKSDPSASLPVFDMVRGKVLQDEGNLDEALKFYQKSIDNENSPPLIQSYGYQQIVDIYLQKGQIEETKAACEKALEVLEGDIENAPHYWSACYSIARLFVLKDKAEEALFYSTKALSLVKEKSPTSYDFLAKATCESALISEVLKDFETSLSNFDVALDYYKKADISEPGLLTDILLGIARVHHELNNLPKAFEAFEKAKEVFTQTYGSESQEVGALLADRGEYLMEKEYTREESKKYLEAGLRILQKQSPQDHEKISEVLENLKKF